MSLANLIVHPDAAYLVTDSGSFERDGTIRSLRPKCMVLEELPLAMTTVGSFGCGYIADIPAPGTK